MRISFLLGAGASKPADMPSTETLTASILSGECPTVAVFLRLIKRIIDEDYGIRLGREANYEDIYYVAAQIRDNKSGDFENPVVAAFENNLETLAASFLAANADNRSISQLSGDVVNCVEHAICAGLRKTPARLDHLKPIVGACLDENVDEVDIFSLNHDTVIEGVLKQHLAQNKVKFTDGFDLYVTKPNLRRWKPSLFQDNCFKVRLLKLHGSIDWYRFDPAGGNRDEGFVGNSEEADIDHLKDDRDRILNRNERPFLLVGTFNKMLSYLSGVFIELHCRFHDGLSSSDRLVIAGYGFGDKGINNQIIDWMCSSHLHQIVVIHPDTARLKAKARLAIRGVPDERGIEEGWWGHWEQAGRLKKIDKGVESVDWSEVRDALGNQ